MHGRPERISNQCGKGDRLQASHLTFAVLIQSNPLNGPGSNQVFIGKYILVITLQ